MKIKVFLFIFLLFWAASLFPKGDGIFIDSGENLGSTSCVGVVLGDLNNDGHLDVYLVNHYWEPDEIWFNDGNGKFVKSNQVLSISFGNSAALGDLDGNGDLDVFQANHDQYNVILLNRGNGYFDEGQHVGNSHSGGVALGDLDRDGDIDAFVTNGFDQPNRVWLNDGNANFSETGQPLGNSFSTKVELGDLDTDGDLDAYVVNYAQPDVVWLNNGDGTFTASNQNLSHSYGSGLGLGDLDKDGDLDVIISVIDNVNEVWMNNGDGIFTQSAQTLGPISLTSAMAIGDMDCDGDLDAYFANVNFQGDQVFFNEGNGIFRNSGQSLGNFYGHGVALGDLDNDGDLDALVGNASGTGHEAYNMFWKNTSKCDHYPIAVAGTSLDENNLLQLDGTLSSDPNGDPLTFSWQIEGETSPRIGQIVSVADLMVGNYRVTLTVSDGKYNSEDIMLFGVPEESPTSVDELLQQVQNIKDTITGFTVVCFDAPNENAAESRRNALLNMLDQVSGHITAGDYQAAISQLSDILAKCDGLSPPDSEKDWIIDDLATETHEQQYLAQMITSLINDLSGL